MKLLVAVTIFISVISLSANAKDSFGKYINMPYSSVRTSLISEGWKTVANKKIQNTSLYAQTIFDQGYKEVLDCVSMERDQCQFLLTNNKQMIVITTKEKALNVESIKFKK